MLIQKYTPTWVTDFEILKHEIESGLQELDFNIEHVGSTSVPDLDSKTIIDMDIIFTKTTDFR